MTGPEIAGTRASGLAKRFAVSSCHHTTKVAAIMYGQPRRSSWFAREGLPQGRQAV